MPEYTMGATATATATMTAVPAALLGLQEKTGKAERKAASRAPRGPGNAMPFLWTLDVRYL